MTETGKTSSSTAERHVPVATIALGQHMLDRGLPHYTDVRFDTSGGGQPRLQVLVFGHSFEAWAESLSDAETKTEPFGATTRYEWAVVNGRLPDSGVRVEVRCSRRVERALQAVHA